MKILITGCAGFIGFHLTRRLLTEGHDVTGVDNINNYYDRSLKDARLAELGIADIPADGSAATGNKGNFTFIQAGVENPELYAGLPADRKFDVICHLAAQAGVRYSIENPQQYITANIDGFFNILEYCRHHKPLRLVFASSSSVYGNSPAVPYREDSLTDSPESLYAATKKANEVMAHSYSALYGINTIGLRFFTVYGPWGRPDMAPFIFTKALLEGKPMRVFDNGNMKRDFTYVDDIVEGIHRVMLDEPESGAGAAPGCRSGTETGCRIYNIGNSDPVNVSDFLGMLERITGKTAEKVYMPMQPGDVRETWADTSRLKNDYGYAPSTPLEKGLREFVEWYRKFYKI